METWLGHVGFTVTVIAVLDPFMAIPFVLGIELEINQHIFLAGGRDWRRLRTAVVEALLQALDRARA